MKINAQECRVMNVGGADEWFPVSYINIKNQNPEGIAYDFAKIVGEKLGVLTEIDAITPWKRMLHYLKQGDIDMAAALYWTRERSELYQYTDPYLINEARIFVKAGREFIFKKFEDLIGRTGGIPTGGSFGESFDRFAKEYELNLIGVGSKDQLAKMLMQERTDYFIQDYLDGMMYLKKNELQNKISVLPNPVSITNVYFAISRQSPCLQYVFQINEIIKESKQNGVLQSIIGKYIN